MGQVIHAAHRFGESRAQRSVREAVVRLKDPETHEFIEAMIAKAFISGDIQLQQDGPLYGASPVEAIRKIQDATDAIYGEVYRRLAEADEDDSA